MIRIGRRATGAIALLIAVSPLQAAEITVPSLELSTRGSIQDDALVLSSRASADVSIAGGYKFGGMLRFAFAANNLEQALSYLSDPVDKTSTAPDADQYNALVDRINNSATLSFRLAKVLIREPFGMPIDFAYFVGRADSFCSGDEFPARFGEAPIGTAFRGYAYFPDGIGGDPNNQYEGIHGVSGTGFSVSWNGWPSVVPILYAYQDSAIAAGETASGKYSTDIRILMNGERVKLEAFAGATLPYGGMGLYRAGALSHFSTGTGASFLAQIGIPYWDPTETFGIDNLYFLFEPRVDFGFISIIMTLFYHPAWYLQRETNEKGVSDVNFKLLLGDLLENSTEGGIEATIGIKGDEQSSDEPFRVDVGPFFAMMTEAVRWDVKLKADVLSYDKPVEMVSMYLGVRTAF